MKYLLAILALASSSAFSQVLKPPLNEEDARKAIFTQACGMIGSTGTGLAMKGNVGRGFIHQPIPGDVPIRTAKGGTIAQIGYGPSKNVVLDMRPGRLMFIIVTFVDKNDYLIWKVPGYQEGRVPVGFQMAE